MVLKIKSAILNRSYFCSRKDRISLNISFKLFFNLLLFIFIVSGPSMHGQYAQDFNNANWSEGWQGDISNFKLSNNQLQLSAPAAGSSYIYRAYDMPKDSIEIFFYLKMGFAPSNDNYSKIYLIMDSPIENMANGYYLKVGENGSNDALMIYKLNNGVSTLLATGTLGTMSTDPSDVWLRCKIYRDGVWNIETNYIDGILLKSEINFQDPSISLPSKSYFGIFANYTSTRADKFFYDDLIIRTIVRDSIAPYLASLEAIDDQKLDLFFSEPISENSAKVIGNYSITPGNVKPTSVSFSTSQPNKVSLLFNPNTFDSGTQYTIQISGLSDNSGNILNTSQDFVLTVRPDVGDLKITEVLTNPYSGGEDFVEIYNLSDKFLKLDGLVIKNSQKNEQKTLNTKSILFPEEYIAISKDTSYLIDTYAPVSDAHFILGDLPSLNIDGANISILSFVNQEWMTVDSFDYDVSMHNAFIDDTKGVSLEKIVIDGDTNDPNNWQSAASSYHYATPGYRNSNFKNGNLPSSMSFAPDISTISPNGDGIDDFVSFNYLLDKSGYLASIKVYDTEGAFLADLEQNTLLGTSGFLKWDGTLPNQDRLRTGMYVIFSRLFHPDGDVLEFKHVIIMAN